MGIKKLADLFGNKQDRFLRKFVRAWALFDHDEEKLELYFECANSIPPNWIIHDLRVGVTDLSGREITTLDLVWTDVSGSTFRAETKEFPNHVRPKLGTRVAPVGDFILFAGESERTLPNLFADKSREDPGDDDSQDDRFP